MQIPKVHQVLIKIGLVPDGTVVTKFCKNGAKFVVKHSIKIYADKEEHRTELRTEGMVFMVPIDGVGLNAVADNVEVLAYLTTKELEQIDIAEAHASEMDRGQ